MAKERALQTDVYSDGENEDLRGLLGATRDQDPLDLESVFLALDLSLIYLVGLVGEPWGGPQEGAAATAADDPEAVDAAGSHHRHGGVEWSRCRLQSAATRS